MTRDELLSAMASIIHRTYIHPVNVPELDEVQRILAAHNALPEEKGDGLEHAGWQCRMPGDKHRGSWHECTREFAAEPYRGWETRQIYALRMQRMIALDDSECIIATTHSPHQAAGSLQQVNELIQRSSQSIGAPLYRNDPISPKTC